MRNCFVLLIATILFTVFSPITVRAELITNGGFETGDLTAWTCNGADDCVADTTDPHAGLYALEGFDNSGYATLSQTIATLVDTTYNFSFFSEVSEQIAGNQLGYSFSGYGNAIFVLPTLSYSQTSGSFVAASSSTPVEFYFSTADQTGFWLIDDVSVTPYTASVPEPGTLILLGFGLLGLAGIRKQLR